MCRRLGLLFLLALALRLAHVSQVPADQILRRDGRVYDQIARSLASGSGFARKDGRNAWGEEAPDKRGATFFSPPLFPVLLSGLYRVGLGPRWMLLLQALAGSVGVVLLARLAGELFGAPESLLAGLLASGSPFLVYETGMLTTEATAIVLAILALYLFHRHLRLPGTTLAIGLGVAAGLGILTRPTMVVLALAFTLVWLARIVWHRRREGAHLVAFWLAVLLVLLPWSVRNYRGMGVPWPTTTSGPYAVFLGWNPGTLRVYEARTRDQYDAGLEMTARLRDTIYQRSRDLGYWERALAFRHEGFRYVAEHPGDAARLWGYKLRHYFTPGVSRFEYPGPLVVASWLFEGLLFALALIGMARRRHEHPDFLACALLVIVGSALLHSLLHVEIRYRVPFVEPLALVCAGAAAGRRPDRRPGAPAQPR